MRLYGKWLVPTLVLIVFFVQVIAATTTDLSRWKGAGMGMFSTYYLRSVWVLNDDIPGSPKVEIPEVFSHYKKALQVFPSKKNSDILYTLLHTYVYFDDGEYQHNKAGHLRLADLPSSLVAAKIPYHVSGWKFTRPLTKATIEVFGVKDYVPGVGMVTMEKLFSVSYE